MDSACIHSLIRGTAFRLPSIQQNYGCKPVPCLKLTTNTPLYERMLEDMDIDCGVLLSGQVTLQKLGQQIFRRVLEVASGSKTKSEEFGFGDNEFLPWRIGAVM